MIRLDYVPNGYQEIVDYYGNPGTIDDKGNAKVDSRWYKNNIAYFDIGMTLRQSWDGKLLAGFIMHKKIAPALIDALHTIRDYGGADFLRGYGLDQWGGVFNPRFKRSGTEPSTHFFAISIDYCPMLGPYRERSRMPGFIVDAFTERGFSNLWKNDGMHNQACTGY